MTVGDPARSAPAAELAERLGHRFADTSLLEQALTHRSWCAEHAGFDSNERLEFLGDAVLGLIVTEHIVASYPELHEGELAKLRARVVSSAVLSEVARRLGLGEALRLGKGEDASGGRSKASILADALEAVIGAVHLDGGSAASHAVVLALFEDQIAEVSNDPGIHDHKTQLQELAARVFDDLPSYDLAGEGPDHDKRFFATVRVGGLVRGTGEGRSKKQAEQAAAQAALRSLREVRGDA